MKASLDREHHSRNQVIATPPGFLVDARRPFERRDVHYCSPLEQEILTGNPKRLSVKVFLKPSLQPLKRLIIEIDGATQCALSSSPERLVVGPEDFVGLL